jgi:hypothetical protein
VILEAMASARRSSSSRTRAANGAGRTAPHSDVMRLICAIALNGRNRRSYPSMKDKHWGAYQRIRTETA